MMFEYEIMSSPGEGIVLKESGTQCIGLVKVSASVVLHNAYY